MAACPTEGPGAGGWFTDEGFWTAYASLLFDERRWAETPAVVDGALALAGMQNRNGLAVLDLCCGPGRHALEFARRGHAVCGVDLTQPYLDAAADSARAEGIRLDLIKADARAFSRPGAFDLAVNLYTSFGYFDDPADDLLMATRLRHNLKPGGVLVMELNGKETAARHFIEGEWFERGSALVLTEFSVVGDWEGIENRWVIIDGQRRVDRRWVQRLYSALELKRLLMSAGFSDARAYGSFSGTPYNHAADTLVMVARA